MLSLIAPGHGVDVGSQVGAVGQPDRLDSHDVGGLVDCGVGGSGHGDLGRCRPWPVVTRPFARRLHGHNDALRSTGGDAPSGALRRVQHLQECTDYLGLVAGQAWEHRVGKKCVVVDIHPVRVVCHVDNVSAAVVATPLEHALAVPGEIVPARFLHRCPNFIPASPVDGEPPVSHGLMLLMVSGTPFQSPVFQRRPKVVQTGIPQDGNPMPS